MREVLSSGVEPAVVPHLISIIGVVRRIATRGAREGTLRAVDPLLMHFGLVGALVFFSSTEPARRRAAAEQGLPFTMPEFADFLRYLEELTLRGLAPDARPAQGPRRGRELQRSRSPEPQVERSALMKRCVFAVLAVLAAAGCRRGDKDPAIVASGHVEATEVTVSSKVPGRLERLSVDEGSVVRAGQEIASLETTDTRLALDAARADRALADAELRLRVAGSRIEDVREAAAQVARAEADLAGAQKDLDRMEGLLAAGSGTTKARDDARTRRDVAAAALDAARERLARLRAGSRPEEIDSARARLAAADARIAQLEQQLKDALVTSPVGGVVTEKLAEQGELLARGTGIVVVSDLPNAWLNAYVAEPDVERLRLGQDAEVVTDGGQSRRGRLSFVASTAEFTPKNVQTRDERVKLVYRIKVALENGDGLFKPGMPSTARLQPAAGRP